MTLYLIAYVHNAISLETAEVEFAIGRHLGGDEYALTGSYEDIVLAFWARELLFDIGNGDKGICIDPCCVPAIPDGWIDYLHREAAKQAGRQRREQPTPDTGRSFATQLGLLKAPEPIKRRSL